jgi:acyl-homoserine lactone synthase
MIRILRGNQLGEFRSYMEQALRLRHKVFVDEMKWEALRKEDEREIDQFDDEHAIHMLAIEGETVIGYHRMLATTRPHLLSHILPELCEGERPEGQNIWELTRFCVEKTRRERGRGFCPTTNRLLSAMVEWGLSYGVDRVIMELDLLWVLRLLQHYFRVTSLGLPKRMGDTEAIAIVVAFDKRTLARLQEMRGDSNSVIMEPVKALNLVA